MASTLTVTAAEATRSFSRLLQEAREGRTITITAHGKPVAQLSPVNMEDADDAEERERRMQALQELRRHWETLTPVTVGPWTRDELYDREGR